MKDQRYEQLAELIVGYSLDLKEGDRLLIEAIDGPPEFVIALIRAARRRGAMPFVELLNSRVQRELLMDADALQLRLHKQLQLNRIRRMHAYIGIRAWHNAGEMSDVPTDRLQLYLRQLKPVTEYRVNKTRWVVLRWPTPSMAQSAGMSTEAFEDFYFKVCCLDYRRMAEAMRPLVELMEKTHEVRIVGPGTDLTFRISGMKAIACAGKRNLPDGEVFTAPIRDSVNGVIQFNTPSIYQGKRFENIRLVFRGGRIVEATANNSTALNAILDTDRGARYVGEFSLGLNPCILQPMCDILFDEKIAGSIHLTPGQAYKECDNGNRSAIHWDLVLIQRPDYGGGEIYFDGLLVRQDGLFIPESLKALNPENLLS